MATVYLGTQTTKLKTILAVEDLIDDSFESKKGLGVLKDEFKSSTSIVLVVEPGPGGFEKHFLCDLKYWLTRERMTNPDLLSAFSPFETRESSYDGGSIIISTDLKSGL